MQDILKPKKICKGCNQVINRKKTQMGNYTKRSTRIH